MKDELLPVGESSIEATGLPTTRTSVESAPAPFTPPITVPVESYRATGTPSPKAQSWGVVISIIIIVLMIVIGAFYAWGKRIAQENTFITPTTTQ